MVPQCLFLDVGQGSSNVVRLDEHRVIVIDCGPLSTILMEVLDDPKIRSIEALILSHNDDDHAGGVNQVLTTHGTKIKRVFYFQDRPVRKIVFFPLLKKWFEEDTHRQEPLPLCAPSKPLQIYPPPGENADVTLTLLYPSFWYTQLAQWRGKPNDASAVLVLRRGERRVVFSGDATVGVWRRIRELRNNRPIEADVLAVPHHGGVQWPYQRQGEPDKDYENRVRSDLTDLYRTVVHPLCAVISVGTGNRSKHPQRVLVEALRDAGADVLCTQITEICWTGDLNELRGKMRPPVEPSRSSLEPGAVGDVACAATVCVDLDRDAVSVRGFREHQTRVDWLVDEPQARPPCRTGAAR